MPSPQAKLFLVTGGNGFIGAHVVRALVDKGNRVRVADIAEHPYVPHPVDVDVIVGDLCDPIFAQHVASGVHTILHFAANMGGMGTIHGSNDAIIYSDNHRMTLNVLSAAHQAGVQRFFYASSACIYPDSLQRNGGDADVSLKESHVWNGERPAPQGLYGLEKLHSEVLLQNWNDDHPFAEGIRIARFHNVYGPGGAWGNGREKAPAAFLRKAFAAQKLLSQPNNAPISFEIWGTGRQRRSFLFIEDCVRAIISLLDAKYSEPLNIGSDYSVSIQELADIALDVAGVPAHQRHVEYKTDKPVGVGSRNSNNTLVEQTLDWRPIISLRDGMYITGTWLEDQIDDELQGLEAPRRLQALQRMQQSKLIHLEPRTIVTFAIVVPITSRGSEHPSDCLTDLAVFAASLNRTTWADTRLSGGAALAYRLKIYLVIDHDDSFLLAGTQNKAEAVLRGAGFYDVVTVLNDRHPKGHVCALWRDAARRAWKDGCDYIVLMGDDVVLQDDGWMSAAHSTFTGIADEHNVPHGFGCVAFTDTSFPGMPTFPIIHRLHLDIFEGCVVPSTFVNQDGDPFLFQLYRRWGCSAMFRSRLSNTQGGAGPARYEKHHASGWTFETLDHATDTLEQWLAKNNTRLRPDVPLPERKLTLDIIVPSYRVDLDALGKILALQPSATCSTMFIIIIDDPRSSEIPALERTYGHRVDVRIRVNKANIGASLSRNRGLEESAAEWVHFLDDDIDPRDDLLVEDEKIIRAHPQAPGFVGTVRFPPATTVFTTAVHLAGVTFFWDIATKIDKDVPWGVTASLLARRNMDGVVFDPVFPKTGGGEDIDFCRKKRQYAAEHAQDGVPFEGFVAAPNAVVTHPWWNGGKRSYWRYYMWSKGDGALIRMYPEHVYRDVAPNAAEMLLASCLLAGAGASVCALGGGLHVFLAGVVLAAAVLCANLMHDLYRHLWRDADRVAGMNSSVGRLSWMVAVVESTFIRIWSEVGRVVGLLERGEVGLLGQRFDWFTGRWGDGPMKDECRNSMQRAGLALALASAVWAMVM